MLGYIRPHAPELRLREYQYYRGVYCGVCRSMGTCTGQCSRMSLSYDFVFLALVRLSLCGGNPAPEQPDRAVHFEKRRCLVHPLRRRPSLERGEVSDYVACAAAVLNCHKLMDDRADEQGAPRLRAAALLPAFRAFVRRAERRYPSLSERIRPHMEALARMEAQGLPSADEPADAFGEVLGELFAAELAPPADRIARHIGHHIGRWLYLIDAADDYEDDVARGLPNPLYRLYHEDVLSKEQRTSLEAALLVELRRAADALDLIDVPAERCGEELSALLHHILDFALPRTTHEVLFPTPKSKKRKPRKEREAIS